MRRSYLDKLQEHLAEPVKRAGPPAPPSSPTIPSDRLKEFYALGCSAQGLSVTQAMQNESIWRRLKSSNDQEVAFFTAGLFCQEYPALPAPAPPQEKEEAAPPSPPPPAPVPVIQLAEGLASEIPPTSITSDLQSEVQLLKTLVGLLEQKIAQPVMIVNEFSSPRVISQEQTVVRNEDGDIAKTHTTMNYESP